MVTYSPQDGTWQILPQAKLLLELRESLGTAEYDRQKQALQQFLCGYFSTAAACSQKLGKSISPIKATTRGGKVLKVRWGLPGTGKSGGLRLVVVAYCEQLRVVIAEATMRKDGLTDAQIETSIEGLP